MLDKTFGFDFEKQWDYENGFYLTSHPMRMSKLLAQYELYKSIINIPGHVVECGVYKGISLIRFASFREMLEYPYSRKIIGFDAFGKFPTQANSEDAEFVSYFENAGGDGISVAELDDVLRHKKFENYELIKGDVADTLPDYVSEHPELRISLLHIDVDVYKPTMDILSNLYDRVSTGGLIVFDDYGTVGGETRAVDEFFEGKDVKIEKLPICHMPAYIRKG